MSDTEHLCRHCGTGGFWSGVGRFFRKLARPSRNEDRLQYIPVAEIQDNPYQPREYVVEGPHPTLRASIEKYGVIVPIIDLRGSSNAEWHSNYLSHMMRERLFLAHPLSPVPVALERSARRVAIPPGRRPRLRRCAGHARAPFPQSRPIGADPRASV